MSLIGNSFIEAIRKRTLVSPHNRYSNSEQMMNEPNPGEGPTLATEELPHLDKKTPFGYIDVDGRL